MLYFDRRKAKRTKPKKEPRQLFVKPKQEKMNEEIGMNELKLHVEEIRLQEQSR